MRLDYLQGACIAIFTAIAAYFDSTIAYLTALLSAFALNILAGFRADEVRITIQRIFPPIFFKNFQGNKFKDSLMELFLITFITYFLKLLIDLHKYQSSSSYVVQFLLAIATYFYFRNSLKNLKMVYPKVKFIAFLYHLIAFKFKELVGSDVAEIINKVEKETEENKDENK